MYLQSWTKLTKNLYPPPPSPANQGWENGAFWLLRGFILDLGGGGMGVCCSIFFCPRLQMQIGLFCIIINFFHINELKRMSHHGISFAVSSFHPLHIPLSSYLIFPVHRLVPLTFDNGQLRAQGLGLARTDSTEWLR